jgi:hypothetical protein
MVTMIAIFVVVEPETAAGQNINRRTFEKKSDFLPKEMTFY